MYPVLVVADAFLKLAKRKGKLLTPLQLMKLVYIAHGFYLAMREGDLFSDRIEAWKYGPVIPELYHATKQYGRSPIPLQSVGDDDPSLAKEDLDFVNEVYEKYGHLSGVALSSLTHKPGTPWYKLYEDGVLQIEIPDHEIQTHYRGIVNEQRSAATS